MFTIDTAGAEPGGERERQTDRHASGAAPMVDAAPALGAPEARPPSPGAVLLRRKGLILLSVVVGATLAWLASEVLQPHHVATARVLVDPRDLQASQNGTSTETGAAGTTALAGYLESPAAIILPDSIRARVVRSEGLDRDPEFTGDPGRTGLARILSRLASGGGDPPRESASEALASLNRAVAVRQGDRGLSIEISVTARDAAKAARIADALANAYRDDRAALRSSAAERAAETLAGRLAEARERLRLAEQKAQKHREANGLIGSGKSVAEEQLALNRAQLAGLRIRLEEAQSKYEQISGTRAAAIETGPIPESVASSTMTGLREQLVSAMRYQAETRTALGARHPEVAEARGEVREARRQIAAELAQLTAAAKLDYDRAVAAEQLIRRRVDQLTGKQLAIGRATVQLRELEREVDAARALYDGLMRRAGETGDLAGIDTTQTRVVGAEAPTPGTASLGPAIVILGGIAGGGIGAAVALMLGWFGTGRRQMTGNGETGPVPEGDQQPAPIAVARPAGPRLVTIEGGQSEPRAKASLPRLGTLPMVRNRRWRRSETGPTSIFQAKALLVDVIDKPKAGFAAAIHAIRTAVAPDGGPSPRRILVLGLHRQAGASTLALNLALDASLSGLPALLVDAAPGPGSLTALFGPAGTGIAAQEAARITIRDEGTGLSFLAQGGQSHGASAQQGASDALARARHFGPIVIDGGALGSDGAVSRLAHAVDGIVDAADDVVLVTRNGAIAAADLDPAIAALGDNAAKIRGYVVNEA